MTNKYSNNATVGARAQPANPNGPYGNATALNGRFYYGKFGDIKEPGMVGTNSIGKPTLDRYFPKSLGPCDLSGLMPYARQEIDMLALFRHIGPNTLHIALEDSVDLTYIHKLNKLMSEELPDGKIYYNFESNQIDYRTHVSASELLASKHSNRPSAFKIKTPTTIKPKAGSPLMAAMLKRLNKE